MFYELSKGRGGAGAGITQTGSVSCVDVGSGWEYVIPSAQTNNANDTQKRTLIQLVTRCYVACRQQSFPVAVDLDGISGSCRPYEFTLSL